MCHVEDVVVVLLRVGAELRGPLQGLLPAVVTETFGQGLPISARDMPSIITTPKAELAGAAVRDLESLFVDAEGSSGEM